MPGTTREDLIQLISHLSSAEIINLLEDNALLDLAFRCSFTMLGPPINATGTAGTVIPTMTERLPPTPPQEVTVKTGKRPLNAFMAFRTYYLKLFPDIQQKTVSGFLTTLWNRDPCRNQWALIAKVYSFVRDEMLLKRRISLGHFLQLSCPVMDIISPQEYLSVLSWSVQNTRDGQKLIKDEGLARTQLPRTVGRPNTEIELLSRLILGGYLPEEGASLLARMGSNNRSLMTTAGPVDTPAHTPAHTPPKDGFIDAVRQNPMEATRDLLGEAFDEEILTAQGIRVHGVADLNSISHLSMQPVYPNPAQFYNYSDTVVNPSPSEDDSSRMEHLSDVPDFGSIDIDNPFDMDAAMGHTQSEGERTAGDPPAPEYDPELDFNFTF